MIQNYHTEIKPNQPITEFESNAIVHSLKTDYVYNKASLRQNHTHFSLHKMENSLLSSKLVFLLAIALVLFLNTELSFLTAEGASDSNRKVCKCN